MNVHLDTNNCSAQLNNPIAVSQAWSPLPHLTFMCMTEIPRSLVSSMKTGSLVKEAVREVRCSLEGTAHAHAEGFGLGFFYHPV